jgi:superfamily II DNA/RNA helicase
MYKQSFGGRNGPPRFRRGQGSGKKSGKIDVSRFIKKAVKSDEPDQEYKSTYSFSDFAIDEKLKVNVVKKGYLTPTPIQDQSIPLILEGKDIVGIANTGTGKTAAFLLPFLNKVALDRSEKVLILAPTRELAQQIRDEFSAFSAHMGIFSELCIGGANIGNQIKNLRRPYNFVIGTPGRIKDLIQRKVLNLNVFRNVVIDEADRMLDMGFIPDVRYLFTLLPREKQTLFFSATISREIQTLIATFLKDPITISVKKQETAENVEQNVIHAGNDKLKRLVVLQDLLLKKEFQKVLIFGRTKHGVEKLSVNLARSGFRVASIHGNKSQSQRQTALNSFKTDKIQALIATDVAARGLDIPNVSHVINFDLPNSYEDYVHRIGRTGRANQMGVALTFVD